ncbi:hypothetical protein SAMN05720469_104136 [Fibrobacter intestinalis]|uniref:Capsule assembly protein Wzi n=1 Tax=Fibrobacter intestinalis TaxID=28122 RepID=A0A1M6RWK1_9BACT|nr:MULTISPECIES: hypothetical protein [Fibrobacter]MDD7299692.1 hypothetical protein [Fibrobacter intestinalis]PBC74848.1 hypothetical protein BGW94_2524 [Fibrobacter sp. NR9]SHK36820.1 hypothetical protein SAMN05720469_104136 [Fibrobacter intestinalis]SJZ95333.1 hypothetical protein SAMN02745108_02055 [Fibrobacter intestinalis]
MRKLVSSFLIASCAASVWATPTQLQLDSIHASLDTLSSNMESTLLGKDDLPVAVSGFMAFRVKNFHYSNTSPAFASDKARMAVDAIFKANIVAMPNSYMTLWTNFAFPFDLSGTFGNKYATQPTGVPTYDERVLYDHSTDYYSSTIDEEFNVGADIRAGVFGAYITAGGVIWMNSSPLTIWERETAPRFAWQYELFEDEKTVSTYYKEKVFKPVKEGGRAFWTNRSFGGVFANVYQLPYNMKAQLLVSQPMDADMGTRDGLRLYAGQPGELETYGLHDMRGSIYHARIAKEKILDNLTVGANYIGVVFDKGIIYEDEFRGQWITAGYDPMLLNTHVASIDVKGNITPKLYLMADIALSMTDSINFYESEEAAYGYAEDAYNSAMATPQVGVYIKAQSKYIDGWPITVEGIYLPKDFYSPYSLSNPSRFTSWRKDEAYLNGGSLRYTPNMMGLNFKLEPTFNRGYFDLQYGQHRQVEEGNDVIVFNYRLNGRNMWESTNSWTKHKPIFWADSGNADPKASGYVARTGILEPGIGIKLRRQRGGLYGGTWEMWESFTAYENVQQIAKGEVPSHAKWYSFLSFMGGYDIGHWFGTDRNIMMTGYAALSGVSTTIAPIAYSEDQTDMLLWSFFGQFEPAIAVTPKFHMVGLLGIEMFRSKNAFTSYSVSNGLAKTSSLYGEVNSSYYSYAPINYLETAIGIGFDWDFADRAGLHVRYKWMTHSDEVLSVNDWHMHYISAETKVWF